MSCTSMKSTFLILCFLCIFCVSICVPVQADTQGPLTTTTPIPSTATDWTLSLAFPQFNPALGILQSVQLDLSGAFTTTITVTNDALTSSSGTAKTEVQFTVQDGGSNLIAPSLDLLSPVFNYSLLAGGSTSSGPLAQTGLASNTYTIPAVLAEFTGAGSFVLPATTFTQTLLANTGGNTSASQVTSASLTGSVTYTYNPIPEPGTLALVGCGLLGLAIRRRARR